MKSLIFMLACSGTLMLTTCGEGVSPCGPCNSQTAETCDGCDNDCDGETDESLARPCQNQCGSGMETCAAGVWQNCNAPVNCNCDPVETCDNVDNDCNGSVDDNLARPCSNSCGQGEETCVSGAWVNCTAPQNCACAAGQTETSACGVSGTMSRACDAAGQWGEWSDCVESGRCQPNTFENEACGVTQGECRQGTMSRTCSASGEWGEWSECGGQGPVTEVCDAKDNDCDGGTDEDDVCGQPDPRLCARCTSNDPCQPGGLCLRYSDDNTTGYCGIDCSQTACPAGYNCENIGDNQGNIIGKQCVSAAGSCKSQPQQCDPACGPDEYCSENGQCLPVTDDCVPEGPHGEEECEMLRLVNQDRAEHFEEVAAGLECPNPLSWDAEWARHGRDHSQQMADQGQLFHADFPSGQNCAMAGSVEQAEDLFMWSQGEDPCPAMTHHCNIMRCGWSHIGIGVVVQNGYYWITQNFY